MAEAGEGPAAVIRVAVIPVVVILAVVTPVVVIPVVVILAVVILTAAILTAVGAPADILEGAGRAATDAGLISRPPSAGNRPSLYAKRLASAETGLHQTLTTTM